jgi:predicted TIM-barrel fold metal-dependent hydrolase
VNERSMSLGRRAFLTQLSLLAGCAHPAAMLRLRPDDGRRARAAAAPIGVPDFVVDAHCHLFSPRDLDIDAFVRGLMDAESLPPPLRGIVESISALAHRAVYAAPGSIERYDRSLQAAFSMIPQDRREELGLIRRVWSTLRDTAGEPDQIFANLQQASPQAKLFMPALVDFQGWVPARDGLAPPRPLDEQIERLRDLADRANRMAGPKVLPLLAFNPLRELQDGGHLQSVKALIKTGAFVGIKVYPPCGFSATNNARDPRLARRVELKAKRISLGQALDDVLDDFYTFCEEEQVPLMSHTNNSNGMREGAGFCASPWGWRDVLSQYSKLRLNFAHFGHMEGAASVQGAVNSVCVSWAKHIAELMSKYDHVYADIGYSGLADGPGDFGARYARYLIDLKRASENKLGSRLMYGSDWWLCKFETRGDEYWNVVSQWFADNLEGHEHIWADNALRFLGFGEKDNKNARRIRQRWPEAPWRPEPEPA